MIGTEYHVIADFTGQENVHSSKSEFVETQLDSSNDALDRAMAVAREFIRDRANWVEIFFIDPRK